MKEKVKRIKELFQNNKTGVILSPISRVLCSVYASIAVLSLLFVNTAFASLAVSPLRQTVQVQAGAEQIVVYKVANKSNEAMELNINARTWFNLPENTDIGVEDWLSLGIDSIVLAPNEEKTLNFKIAPPKQAVGELTAMIYFAQKRIEGQMLGTSYGVSLYVFIKGTEKVALEIGDVLLSKRDGKNYIAITIKNNGNVHFRPQVSAKISAGDFKKAIELPFGKPIFGGKDYTFVGIFEDELPSKGKAVIKVECNYANSSDTIIKKKVEVELKP